MVGSEDLEPLVWKTHYHTEDHNTQFDRAIHLIRHPYDAIDSYHHYKRDFDDNDLDWGTHITEEIRRWRDHTLYWTSEFPPRPVHTLRYEDLLRDPARELASCLRFLEVLPVISIKTVVAKTKLPQIWATQPQDPWVRQFYRRGVAGEGYLRFTKEQRTWAQQEIGHLVVDYGYEL
jgi:hypothetical protein